jgi:hypothetical protein
MSLSEEPDSGTGTVDLTVFPALIAEHGVRRERCRDERDTIST